MAEHGRQREAEIKRSRRLALSFLTYDDDSYPDGYGDYDPSSVLWVRGEVKLLSAAGIAVVGTRRPSPYGAGMARCCRVIWRDVGGDSERYGPRCGQEAHKGALEARGRTVRLGTGIDVIYPPPRRTRGWQSRYWSWAARFERVSMGTFPAPQTFRSRKPDS